MRVMRVLSVAIALLVPSLALAQDPDPGAARASAQRTVDCLERVNHDLEATMRLLRDAARQTESTSANARRDAVHMVTSLQQRAADLARALKDCVPEDAHLTPQTVVREPTGNEASVREHNDIPSVEQDARLADNVHAIVGQRVDGTGHIDDAHVKRGIRVAAGRMERCYEQLVNRGALQTGQLNLVFSITSRGRVRGVRVERSTFDNARFDRCVQNAGEHIRPGAGASGGDVRYSYTLRFGSSS